MAIDTYVQKKLKLLRNEQGYTLEQLATKLETTPITLSRYETGKRSVSLCILEEICQIYNMTVTEFFLNKQNSVASVTESLEIPSVSTTPINTVGIYGEIAAGYFNTAQENYIDEIEIPQALSKRFGNKNLFGLAVHGESMNKIVQNNDYVILNKQNSANNGDIVAVMLNNEDATLKRFYQLDSETIILKPESNDASFHPITIDLRQPEAQITILGKVIWYCAPYHHNF